MKRTVAYILITVLLLLSCPISFAVAGFAMPPQFDESYYGELGEMHDRLAETEGKKIVVLGTSSVAFGVDSSLLENEINACGYDYTVCNFGLYGTLGNKMMLDLSRKHIKKGDVVIFAPEMMAQELSMYFSAEHAWRALDGHFDMLSEIGAENRRVLLGNYPYFVAEKTEYLLSGEKAYSDGVYNRSSFNERCDMVYDRPYNTMPGGYDENALISLTPDIFEKEFIGYVNDYAAEIEKAGASIYYAFAPMNADAFDAFYGEEELYEFYSFIRSSFDFKVIGTPARHIYESGWFYDSNVHLNSSGMILNTLRLAEDLKTEWDITSPALASAPEMPETPDDGETGTGNNDFEEYFTYGENADGTYRITGAARNMSGVKEVIIPYSHNGKKITSVEASVFAGNGEIEKITMQTNIKTLYDGMFDGCTSLTALILEETHPASLAVGGHLLDGAPECWVYVSDETTMRSFRNAYFWGHYAGRLKVL